MGLTRDITTIICAALESRYDFSQCRSVCRQAGSHCPGITCHRHAMQDPTRRRIQRLAVLAAVCLHSYGKHLETNQWCRIQGAWKYRLEYHLILVISTFTAPKILTTVELGRHGCGDWSYSIRNAPLATTAHKQSGDLLTMQLRGQAALGYSKQANKYSGYILEFIKLLKVLYWPCKSGMCV